MFFKTMYRKKIKYNPKKSVSTVNNDLKLKIYTKTIIQSFKETGVENITLSISDFVEGLYISQILLEKNISFIFGRSDISDKLSDYLLMKFGVAVPVVCRIKNGLYVYLGGEMILFDKNVYFLDITSNENQYLVKNVDFPVKINSLQILSDALTITNKSFSDIIIKPCIILKKDE